jgi:glycosyltransferase involved in cell wall biosynthesis
LGNRSVALESRAAALESALSVLNDEARTARIEMVALQAQVSHLLSLAEVPEELTDEYLRWKECNPVPNQPLVSVCVATYNRSHLLTERCIASVLQQTYDRLELIVVGDGCTDDTEEVVSRIQDPRLRFVNLRQRGTYPADPMLRWMVAGTPPLNHALSIAQGHYITHLDDDDEYLPDRLEKLVAFAMKQECDFVWHPFFQEHLPDQWIVHEANDLALGQVTTSSVFYRSWFTRITLNPDAYRLREPGDWNRFRRIKRIAPVAVRFPEPLLRHYREHMQRH